MMKAEYVSHMGDDLTVVNAARVSFDKESEWEPVDVEVSPCGAYLQEHGKRLSERDTKLINYLANHGHWTPFSHPQITMREKVPIFVARQRFKHMVGFTYNEVSRRYVDDTPEFFFPDKWRARPIDGAKQGSSDEEITEMWFQDYGENYEDDPAFVYSAFIEHVTLYYNSLIEGGVAPEQARMILPQSMYTEYYVTGSLAAWARAYKQRADSHSQKEIRDLAVLDWGTILEPLFPVSWKALTEGEK